MILINKTDQGDFKAYVPLETGVDGKVKIFEKSVKDGDEERKVKFLRGEASNTKIDKALERVSPQFIKKMRDTVKGRNVFVEHEHHLLKTVGFVDETDGNNDSFIATTALEPEDDNLLVKALLSKIKHGTKLFYSIAGKITKATKQFVEDVNAEVTELIDGEVYELSFTALPEGNVGFVEPIMKSFKELLKNKNLTNDEIITLTEKTMKTLDEMVQRSGIEEDLSNLFWSFRSAVSRITYDSDLTPAKKKDKIISLSEEYGQKVEKLATEVAELTEEIESELS
jgi:hypothetical protein